MTRRLLALSVVFLLAAGGAAAWSRTTTPAKVTFKAIMKPGGAFEGTTPDLVVKDTGDNVRLIVALQNLDTGMSLRNPPTALPPSFGSQPAIEAVAGCVATTVRRLVRCSAAGSPITPSKGRVAVSLRNPSMTGPFSVSMTRPA